MPPITRRAAREAREAREKNYYLICTDVDGSKVEITFSATGEGTHTRWHYPDPPARKQTPIAEQPERNSPSIPYPLTEYDCFPDPLQRSLSEMANPIERHSTPPRGSSGSQWPQTPLPQRTFDAGSVIRTPVKKLQRSPDRIGWNGVNFWKEDESGVLSGRMYVDEESGSIRYVPNHAAAENVDMTRSQVVERQLLDDEKIFLAQIEKFFDRKYREDVTRRMVKKEGSDSGFEDMDEDTPTKAQGHPGFGALGSHGTVIIEESDEEELDEIESEDDPMDEDYHHLGPGGEKPDSFGRRLLGPEGTTIIEPYFHPNDRSLSATPAPTEIDEDEDKENHENGTVRLGSVVNTTGTVYEVFLRPKKARQGSVGPNGSPLRNANVAGPSTESNNRMRRKLGPHGTHLIDPVTYRAMTP